MMWQAFFAVPYTTAPHYSRAAGDRAAARVSIEHGADPRSGWGGAGRLYQNPR
jgi:hypothetical protein